ncbi:hypothetical protein [Paludibaculum fermentans]|uniref:Uncharacterized protein n=1 Tax=Paludibaculum fermentans TaxID=1473598 RepID=A0A7S7NXG5_PALFE|nr:hypothetical protein [Paludibaculum fermentans]QOY91557.1 hypothetical protein IRI77_16900 [Paludibaculum fermentans]
MDQKITEFTRDVENLIRSASEDTTDALCAINRTEHSFDAAAAGLRERLLKIPPPQEKPPVFIPPPPSLPQGRRLTRRDLSLGWLMLMAGAMVAFAFGYIMGLPPDQRFRSRNR